MANPCLVNMDLADAAGTAPSPAGDPAELDFMIAHKAPRINYLEGNWMPLPASAIILS